VHCVQRDGSDRPEPEAPSVGGQGLADQLGQTDVVLVESRRRWRQRQGAGGNEPGLGRAALRAYLSQGVTDAGMR
jgi:hypothetical protein